MKRFALAVMTGLISIAMAGPSSAADLPRGPYITKAPMYYAPVFTWTGFYVGANAGYAWGNAAWAGGPSFGTQGWLGGGTLGYNLQSGSFVWGLEGDIDYSTNKATNPCCTTRNTWLGTARGRIGYALDRFMPYATGGAAFGGVKMTPAGGGSVTDTRVGWTAGAGVEWAFLGAWSAKIEYLYVDLGSADCSVAACGVTTKVKFNTNMIRTGVNYRF
jgi:outer membrane immunogenic protein